SPRAAAGANAGAAAGAEAASSPRAAAGGTAASSPRAAAGATAASSPSAAATSSPRALGLRLRRALARLQDLTNACLRRHLRPGTQLALGGSGPVGRGSCFDAARRAQLRRYVAPPALLFVSGPTGVASASLDLSARHRVRIAGVAALILLLTIL